MDKKLKLFKRVEDISWELFYLTGSPFCFGQICGAKDLIKEREMELKDQNGREM